MPYNYEGMAKLNKDILEFNDNDYDYIFDFGIKRLIKSNKDNKIIIDFDKEEIIMENENKLALKIKVLEYSFEENRVLVKYLIDKEEISLLLDIKEVEV